MMQAAKRNPVTEFFFRIHPWVYRRTGGRIPGRLGGAPILLLNTRGASEISRSSCSSPSGNSQDLEYDRSI
jgi:hypothetical protein